MSLCCDKSLSFCMLHCFFPVRVLKLIHWLPFAWSSISNPPNCKPSYAEQVSVSTHPCNCFLTYHEDTSLSIASADSQEVSVCSSFLFSAQFSLLARKVFFRNSHFNTILKFDGHELKPCCRHVHIIERQQEVVLNSS